MPLSREIQESVERALNHGSSNSRLEAARDRVSTRLTDLVIGEKEERLTPQQNAWWVGWLRNIGLTAWADEFEAEPATSDRDLFSRLELKKRHGELGRTFARAHFAANDFLGLYDSAPRHGDMTEAIVQMDGDVYADTAFLNASRGLLPGFTLQHMGFGEFYLAGPGGAEIQFDRMRGKPFPGQSGRSHKVYDNKGGKLVQQLLAAAQSAGLAEHIHEVAMTAPQSASEAEKVPGDPKAAKAGHSFPAGLDRRKAAALAKAKAKGEPGAERVKRKGTGGPSPKGGMPKRKGMSHSREEKGRAVGKRRKNEVGLDRTQPSGPKPAAGRGGGDRDELPGAKGSGKAVGEAALAEVRTPEERAAMTAVRRALKALSELGHALDEAGAAVRLVDDVDTAVDLLMSVQRKL